MCTLCTDYSAAQAYTEADDPLELAEEKQKRKLICRSRSEQELRRCKENLYKQLNAHYFAASQRDAVLKRAKPVVAELEQHKQPKPSGSLVVSTPVLLSYSMFSRPLSSSYHGGLDYRRADYKANLGYRTLAGREKAVGNATRPSELEEYCYRGLGGSSEQLEDLAQVYCTYDMFKQQGPRTPVRTMSTDAQLLRASLILTRYRATYHSDAGRSTYVQRCASRAKELKRPSEERSLCFSMLK